MHSTAVDSRARRTWLLVAAALTVAVGLVTHFLGSGPLADFAGDALYAVMISLVIAFVLPRASVLAVGISTLVLCTLIEVFQLTGLPALWAEHFWPVGLVLGAGFDPRDLVAYAIGAALAAFCDLALTRRRRAGARGERRTSTDAC